MKILMVSSACHYQMHQQCTGSLTANHRSGSCQCACHEGASQ